MASRTEASDADIRSAVLARYSEIAETHQAGKACACCGGDEQLISLNLAGPSDGIYAVDDLGSLPEDVTGMSLGCGDPITLAALKPGQTVVDLGSGGGIDCFLAARRVGPTGKVIGVDMTAAMIAKARENAAKLGDEVSNVEFRLGEIEHLPVADGTVDVIISNCVINLAPDKHQVFREAFRVLAPGGKLAVSDMVTHGELRADVQASLAAWAGCVAGAWDVADYKAAIEAAGFVDVEVTPVYLDRSYIDQGLERMEIEIERDEALYKSLFSAKVTAWKPA